MVSLTPPTVSEREIGIHTVNVLLEGNLALPARPRGVVVFAHGSGSSRHSPRNRFVARVLQESGMGTLLMDLLTREEEAIDAQTRHLRFDIPLLAERLVGAVDWLTRNDDTQTLPVGCFGASTGAAAALIAAASCTGSVRAVVSRGGRPDLAGDALARVRAPTLLIVGSIDPEVLRLNEQAAEPIRAVKRIEIVPGATHLFQEPGTLERAAELAAQWFRQYLCF
jgi:dienelactone hydrolase